MLRKILGNAYLVKEAPGQLDTAFVPPTAGERKVFEVKFRPATAGELKALGDDIPDGYVAGWASTPDLDLYRHRVMPGAFQGSIQERGLIGPRGIKLLIGHDWDKVAGVIRKLEYRNGGLWIEAQLALAISYVRDVYEAAKMVEGLSFSVGFMLEKYAVEKDDDDDEWLRIDKGDLYEVSIVPFPGNEEATMDFVKGRDDALTCATIAEFEKHLVASGLVKSRNQARRVTQVVKAALPVFTKAAAPSEEKKKVPLLAPDTVKALQQKVAELKQILAQ